MAGICAFCLSNDRNVTFIDEKYWKIFYPCITPEDDLLKYLKCLQQKQALQICWECRYKLKNLHQFISTSQQCVRVLNTYLEDSTQTLPATTSKLCRTHTEIVYTDSEYEETKTEDVTDTETEDVADTIDTGPIYEKIETEDVTDNLDIGSIYEETEAEDDVKMENDPLKIELNNIADNNNWEVINSHIIEEPCTSVDLEMIKEQVTSWRVILHRLPTDTLPANIMSSGVPVTLCDDTNSSRIQIAVFKIPEQKKRVSLNYMCDHCQQTFLSKIKLQQHISIHYGVSQVNLTCQTCNYNCGTVQALEKHSRLHDEKRRFKCNSCTFRFAYKQHLMQHVRRHTGEKPYKCDFCDYAGIRSSDVREHMKTHTGEKPYRCDLCDHASSKSNDMKKHMRTHTGKKPYKCHFCNYASSRNCHLKSHIRTHTGEQPYKCDLCDYTSKTSCSLKEHMKSHTGEKPYKCDLCDYAGTYRYGLKKHMRIHTGEKPYKCDLCDYACRFSGNFKEHMRTHTGEKPHKCDLCGFASKQRFALKEHMRIHTGEKPYKCDKCDYRSHRSGSLRRHKKQPHSASSAQLQLG